MELNQPLHPQYRAFVFATIEVFARKLQIIYAVLHFTVNMLRMHAASQFHLVSCEYNRTTPQPFLCFSQRYITTYYFGIRDKMVLELKINTNLLF